MTMDSDSLDSQAYRQVREVMESLREIGLVDHIADDRIEEFLRGYYKICKITKMKNVAYDLLNVVYKRVIDYLPDWRDYRELEPESQYQNRFIDREGDKESYPDARVPIVALEISAKITRDEFWPINISIDYQGNEDEGTFSLELDWKERRWEIKIKYDETGEISIMGELNRILEEAGHSGRFLEICHAGGIFETSGVIFASESEVRAARDRQLISATI